MNILLAAALVAATAKSAPAPADLRVACSGDATAAAQTEKGKPPVSKVISFSNEGQRIATLPSGRVLIAKEDKADGQDELLLQENGRYRRIVKGNARVRYLAESPDGAWVAVIVSTRDVGSMEVPQAAMYLFDTVKWEGREINKNFGFTAIAWSPDSKYLAYGEFSKARFVEAATLKLVDSCVFDSQVTTDGNERVRTFFWIDGKHLRLTYQNQAISAGYVVSLP